ncbi:transposase [Methylobacterium soli]|uniref:Uncharacterized protein n=1 Tax=Methylobacterium soli TaxID=553447 RepID=A0A6L3SX63_9HYPH|nr:transposase [Methylobacterium soli]KAB1077185.1 hypothetical protein F6X53_20110 [Methylobacterium soli]
MNDAGWDERTSDRQTYRNGFWDRSLDTWLGTLQLCTSKLRLDAYFPRWDGAPAASGLSGIRQCAAGGGERTRRVPFAGIFSGLMKSE